MASSWPIDVLPAGVDSIVTLVFEIFCDVAENLLVYLDAEDRVSAVFFAGT